MSDIGEETFRGRAHLRELRLEGLGMCSMLLGTAAFVGFFIPGLAGFAWIPAAPAVVVGFVGLGLKVDRRRYAIVGTMFGVIAFSWSIAMVLFGSAH